MKNILLLLAALVLLSNVVLAVDTSPKGKALGHYIDAIKAYKSGDATLTKAELRTAAGDAPNPLLASYLAGLEFQYNKTGQLDSKLGRKILLKFGLPSGIDPMDPFNPNPAPKTPKQKLKDLFTLLKENRN